MATNHEPTNRPMPGFSPALAWRASQCLNKQCNRIKRELVLSMGRVPKQDHWIATCRDCGCQWTEVTNIK